MSEPESGLPFRLPWPALEDVACLTDLSERLDGILAGAVTLVSEVPFEQYPEAISARVGIPRAHVESAFDALRNLRQTQHLLKLTANDFLDKLTKSLEVDAPAPWRQHYLEKWAQSRGPVARALASLDNDHPIVLLWKSRSLAARHENGFQSCVVITDIRPTFNQAGDAVKQTIVSHVLIIDYSTVEGPKRIQIALDATDLGELKEACERAHTKAETIKASLATLSWPTAVPGEKRK